MKFKERLIAHLLQCRQQFEKTQDEMAAFLEIGYRTYQDIESTGIVKKTTDLLNIIEKTGFDITQEITYSTENNEFTKAPEGRFPKRTKPGELIEFYDTDFAAGEIEFYDDNNTISPSYTMDIPDFAGCTAFRTYGTSMEKLIKSGSILFGTKLEEWKSHLEYGQIYGIICTDKRKYLKYIRKGDDNLHFLLKSENKEMYDDMVLPKEKIRSIWLIHGWINKRT